MQRVLRSVRGTTLFASVCNVHYTYMEGIYGGNVHRPKHPDARKRVLLATALAGAAMAIPQMAQAQTELPPPEDEVSKVQEQTVEQKREQFFSDPMRRTFAGMRKMHQHEKADKLLLLKARSDVKTLRSQYIANPATIPERFQDAKNKKELLQWLGAAETVLRGLEPDKDIAEVALKELQRLIGISASEGYTESPQLPPALGDDGDGNQDGQPDPEKIIIDPPVVPTPRPTPTPAPRPTPTPTPAPERIPQPSANEREIQEQMKHVYFSLNNPSDQGVTGNTIHPIISKDRQLMGAVVDALEVRSNPEGVDKDKAMKVAMVVPECVIEGSEWDGRLLSSTTRVGYEQAAFKVRMAFVFKWGTHVWRTTLQEDIQVSKILNGQITLRGRAFTVRGGDARDQREDVKRYIVSLLTDRAVSQCLREVKASLMDEKRNPGSRPGSGDYVMRTRSDGSFLVPPALANTDYLKIARLWLMERNISAGAADAIEKAGGKVPKAYISVTNILIKRGSQEIGQEQFFGLGNGAALGEGKYTITLEGKVQDPDQEDGTLDVATTIDIQVSRGGSITILYRDGGALFNLGSGSIGRAQDTQDPRMTAMTKALEQFIKAGAAKIEAHRLAKK